MKINQLFIKTVDLDTLKSLLDCFDLRGLNDARMFSKKELEQRRTLEKLAELKPILQEYYLKCKSSLYLENMTEKKALTVLKQVIRLYGYSLESTEKNINNKKLIYYKLMSLDSKNTRQSISISRESGTLDFY